MLQAFAVLLTFQCLGEGVSYLFGLPVPAGDRHAAVRLRDAAPAVADAIEPTALELLRHLSLLFVPAGVGIMVSADRVRGDAVAVVVALAVSTTLAIAVTALVTRALLRRRRGRRGGRDDGLSDTRRDLGLSRRDPAAGLTITLIAYLFAQAVMRGRASTRSRTRC